MYGSVFLSITEFPILCLYKGIAMRKLTLDELSASRVSGEKIGTVERLPIIGLLDNIRSLYNVGSIFRTSDGARVESLILCGFTPHPPRKEIDKTALGATTSVPWLHFRDPLDGVAEAKRRGARICVLEQTTKSIPYYELTAEMFPLCIVVGNELTGVSPAIVAAADMAVDIPMFGVKQSLNASVAYGIAIFDLVRIWRQASRGR
jgi:tRNA G18 (ribose-2'-O)-methylase SpoU